MELVPRVRAAVAPYFEPVGPRAGWQWLNPLLFVVGTLVSLLRVPSDTRFVLWAEDGNTFLAQAYEHGGVTVITDPYAGYMHLVPRLTAWFVRDTVPFLDSGQAMATAAAMISSACLLGAFHWSRAWLSTPAASLLWLVSLLMPAAALELGLNVADSHWWLMYVAFWALLSRDRGITGTVAASLALFAAALSDPLVGVLVPLALVRVVGSRRWRQSVPSIVFGVALVLQAFVVLGTERTKAAEHIKIGDLFHQAVLQVGFATVAGGQLGDRLALAHPARVFAIGVFVVVATVVAAVLVVRRKPLALVAVVHAIVFYSLVEFLVWPTTRVPAGVGPLTWGQRYAFNALLLVAVAWVAVADALLEGRRFRAVRWTAAGAIAATLLWSGIAQPQSAGYRKDLPTLAEQMPSAVAACRSGAQETYAFVILPLELYTWPVSCDVVLASADKVDAPHDVASPRPNLASGGSVARV